MATIRTLVRAVTTAGILFLNTGALADEELTETQQLWVNSFDAEKGGDYDKALETAKRLADQS